MMDSRPRAMRIAGATMRHVTPCKFSSTRYHVNTIVFLIIVCNLHEMREIIFLTKYITEHEN